MEIKRDRYLNKLISFMWDGQVKVITGIRRCGKSYLLRNLFRTYLLGEGVPADHILSFELDLTRDIRYRNPLELANRVREIVENQREQFYLFVDEIQMSDEVPNPYNPDGKKITFYEALNDLKSLSNLDIYVTGSNSRMLSSDILTEFRGRSDEIRVHPLSFAEYYSAVGGDKEDAFENYAFYVKEDDHMSYRQAMYDREHPRYSEPTEYITMEVDGLIVALHFKNTITKPDTVSEIEQTLLMAQDFENLNKPA